jgi:phospho-N-acetylmuramoyl-pentapeptide-transferase
MQPSSLLVETIQSLLGFTLFACLLAFLWAPILTHFLYKYKITRRSEYRPEMDIESRRSKVGTPIMGGLLVVITIAVITYIFNWSRPFTWVPVGVMMLSAFLGGLDDLLNIFGTPRRSRKISHVINLIRIHKSVRTRLWLAITLPWAVFKRIGLWMGSHPGRGMHVHEKLLMQFASGAIAAWWLYFKLGEHWRTIYLPFTSGEGYINIEFFIIPLFIFIVMASANSVNIADGLDGLAGGALIPTFAALGVLAWAKGLGEVAILNAVTVGALVTYTYFNVKPARFQMGDVGSLGLGALLGINAIVTNQIITLPLLAFIFVIETLSVIAQVISRHVFGRRILRMAPLHHHFELVGWSEEKIVMRFWIVHLAAVILGLWIGLH